MKTFNYPEYQESVYYEKLSNGLEVYLVNKPKYLKKYCQLTVKFGSASAIENTNYSGIAHYFEHMMFNTKDGDASETFLQSGANINAFTSYDQTTYYFDTINNFSSLITKLLEIIFRPTFNTKAVEKERNIILQELEMGLDNPNNRMFFETLKCLFFNHYFKYEIVGEKEDVKSITKANLNEVFKTAYNPNNCILFIIGDIDVVKTLEEVKNTMNAFNISKVNLEVKSLAEPKEVKTLKQQINLDFKKNLAAIGFKLKIKDPSRYLKKLSIVLSYSISSTSKLYEFMLDNDIINTSYYYNYACDKDFGFLYICSETKNSQKFFELLIDELTNFSIDQEEYEKYKLRMYGGLLQELNSLEDYAYSFVTERVFNTNLFETKKVLDDISISELNDMKNEFKYYSKLISY